MLEYQKSPKPGTTRRAANGFVFAVANTHTSAGTRAVRRRRDFWYSSMSDGVAPPSGLAQTEEHGHRLIAMARQT
jgi:hypothetical protein